MFEIDLKSSVQIYAIYTLSWVAITQGVSQLRYTLECSPMSSHDHMILLIRNLLDTPLHVYKPLEPHQIGINQFVILLFAHTRLDTRTLNQSRVFKRGIEYNLEVAILMSTHVKDRETHLVSVYRQIFTMLEFRKTGPVAKNSVTKDANEDRSRRSVTLGSQLQMSLLSTDPLKWAALCKDYNLIHLFGFAAKLFGLPGKLATTLLRLLFHKCWKRRVP
jgi:hypothetical protein